MKTITCIANYKEGDSIQGFYLCVEKHLRHTRSGDLFLDLQLRDRTGSINGKIWDNVDKLNEKFNAGDPVAVSGNVDSFKERPQLIVKKINRASVQYYGRYGYDPSLIVPSSSKNPNDMWKAITKIISSIKSNPLRKLVSMIYRENKEILLVHPASVKMHHNYRSGFIEHVLSMAEIANQLAVHYQLDCDLLIAGVFLHDIGKIIEISSDLEAEYTDEGNFIGHIVIGRDILRSAAKKITNFPEDIQIKLEHMILSHQGKYESQSLKKPIIREALLLHLIDNMDAKMNLFALALEESAEGGDWTDQHNHFRIPLYKGDNETK
ncbi:MAG: 3'-5' exoribonuclease YhaM family protein [Candidatus Neomarinimicrobiota bacterium]